MTGFRFPDSGNNPGTEFYDASKEDHGAESFNTAGEGCGTAGNQKAPGISLQPQACSAAGGQSGSTPKSSKSPEEEIPVLLTVTGKQTDPDDNTQENTAVYRALCARRGEGHLFTYRAEDTQVCLFVSRGSAWMQRGGRREARMVFDPSLPRTQCDYETAYGVIPMEVRTDHISVLSGGTRGLQARIRYALIMGPEYELKCSVTIKTQQIV